MTSRDAIASRQKELFRIAFLDSADAVIVLTREGRIFSWSRGAAGLLGYTQEEVANCPFDQLLPKEKRASFRMLCDAAAGNPLVKNVEYDLLHKEGFVIKTLLTVDNHWGGAAGACVLWVKPFDPAFLRQLNDPALHDTIVRLQQLSAIGQLTAALAHQIRTPLHVIQSTVEFLQEQLPPGSPSAASFDMLSRNIELIKNLSNALSGFTHYKVHGFAPGELNKLVDQVCLFIKMLCEKQGIRIKKSLGDLPLVRLDGDFLTGALYNLMANAVEAMPKGGDLDVSTERRPEGVVLTVSDTGGGIDETLLDQIGRPFFTTKSTGTGLGLFVVRQILDQHKASLRIESQKGKGTRMTVTFPIE